jgi:trans-aconitate 2-methyltransferase
MTDWDDRQYLKFGQERTRAAEELLARVPLLRAEHVLDLGCGPGNSTALLSARFPMARVTGVDSSASMLERARSDYPDAEWVQADLKQFRPDVPVDLLFANAVLQWLPDHATLFVQLLEQVRPGGVLALQVPHNFDEPSHRLMREVPGPFAKRIQHVRTASPVAAPAFYYDLLAPHAESVDIWQTTYEHVMPDVMSIVEWVKATGLRPYLETLTDAEKSVYLDAYAASLETAYPLRRDNKRLFSFPRLFMVVVRSA